MDYDALEKRLKELREDDHERGCEGRFYSCSCDYEPRIDQALKDSQVAIADLRARNEALVEALSKIAPIVTNDGPDYAEVTFSDGIKHSSQAMTMNPQDWLDIQAAYDAALAANREG